MTFPILGGNSVTAGYSIDNSLRFNDNDSPYLTRTPSSASDRRTFTFSFWYKRGNLGSIQHFYTNQNDLFGIESGDYIFFNFNGASAGTFSFANTLLRDVSAWYHIVLTVDTTDATGADRLKLYINGERITPSSSTPPSQNYQTNINNAQAQDIGRRKSNNDRFLDGYLAEFHFIDGTAKSPTDFGEFDEDSGIWKPIEYTGSYGTNGFYLDFGGAGGLYEDDKSGNGNDFVAVNLLQAVDVTTDTPTNNFCTLNPLNITNSNQYLSEGNLDHQFVSGNWIYTLATMAPSSGKWYAEVKLADVTNFAVGFCELGGTGSSTQYMNTNNNLLGTTADAWSILNNYTWIAKKNNNSNTQLTSSGTQFVNNDICMLAIDIDNQGIWFGRNGTWFEGDPSAGTGASYTNLTAGKSYTFGSTVENGRNIWNFGSPPYSVASGNTDDNGYGNFEYAPPTGFLALCTQNLATALSPTIDDGSQYFNTVLYTGNHPTGQSITGVGFQPDWVWGKGRSHAQASRLFDSSRGALYNIISSATNAEQLLAGSLTSFDSDGFTLGSDDSINYNGRTFVAWNWKANGGTTSSNTDGSITSTVQANTTAGFSIVTFTGTGANGTFGHGLGAVPKMIIFKNRTDASNWICYHETLGNTTGVYLNLTNANSGTSSAFFNNTTPTSSVVSVGGMNEGNGSGDNIVAYCFAEIEGYSKFGSYTGNGSTDGTFVYTGFRPAFVIVKCSSSSQSGAAHWIMYDIKRNTYNVVDELLYANLSNNESANDSSRPMDILSNGFKLRGSGTGSNASGSTYIYMAFAENPFVSSTGIPVTAR